MDGVAHGQANSSSSGEGARPSLQTLLGNLDREQVVSLLLQTVEQHPDLARAVEEGIQRRLSTLPPSTTSTTRERLPHLDLADVRRQMSAALRMEPAYGSGWYGFQLGREASQLLEQAWSFIHAGNGQSALEILNVMTDQIVENWEVVIEDESGEVLDFVQEEVGSAWIEAILSADVTPNEREGWAVKLDGWESELGEYGDTSNFSAAVLALQEGWDDPEIQRILRGEAPEPEYHDVQSHEDLEALNRLTMARLNVLERQGRFDEYLNLASAEGQVARYTVMLVRQGRPAEAADYGQAYLERTDDALHLAQTLRNAGELELALRIAEHGLRLEGRKAPLAVWLTDVAAGTGKEQLAVSAATIAFDEERTLDSYLRVQHLAGAEWPERREDLLGRLRTSAGFTRQGPVDIFLHEGLIDDAIALVDGDPYSSPQLVEQVAAAAIRTHPDWVIQALRKQAEPIMDQKKADKYETAVRRLEKVKDAYTAAGRQGEWQEYLAGLLAEHHRKYKLVPLLRRIG